MEEKSKTRIGPKNYSTYILVGILVLAAISYLVRTYEFTCNRTSNGQINCLFEKKIFQLIYSRDQINNITSVYVQTKQYRWDEPGTVTDESRFEYTVILVFKGTSTTLPYSLYTFYDKSDATALQSQINTFIYKPDQRSFKIQGIYGNDFTIILAAAIFYSLLSITFRLSKQRSKLKKDSENKTSDPGG